MDVKTYTRKDHDDGLHRLGFIAQHVKASLPKDGKFQNLVTTFMHNDNDSAQEVPGVDYSRLVMACLCALVRDQVTTETHRGPGTSPDEEKDSG